MADLFITEEKLVEWADAKAEALEQILRLRKEADSYSEKIRAFIVLARGEIDDKTLAWAEAAAAATSGGEMAVAKVEAENAGPSMIDAIEKVVNSTRAALSHGEIRELLPTVGYDAPVTSSSGYFYTAVKRLVERGLIAKSGDKLMSIVKL